MFRRIPWPELERQLVSLEDGRRDQLAKVELLAEGGGAVQGDPEVVQDLAGRLELSQQLHDIVRG